MKYCMMLTASMVMILTSVKSQKGKIALGKRVQVEWVTDWGQNPIQFMHPDAFWNPEREKHLLTQISSGELQKVKNRSAENLPCALQPRCDGKRKNSDSLYARLAKLRMYKIATYTDKTYRGIEEYAILRIPYSENKNWDLNAQWDTAYAILPDNCLREATTYYKPKSPPATYAFPAVQLRQWDTIVLRADRTFLDPEAAKQISRQTGSENITRILVFFNSPNYPETFLRKNYPDEKSFYEKLHDLKGYRVASFKRFESGDQRKYAVVRIPYEANKNWDTSATWDADKFNTIYLIVPDKSLKIIPGVRTKI